MTARTEAVDRKSMSPLKFLAILVVVIVVAVAGVAGGFVLYGREAFWADLFGPPDQGPYDFAAPTRTGKLNDALACPDRFEPCVVAGVNRITPLFAVDAETLFAEIRARVAAMPGTAFVAEDAGRGLFRAVVRTPVFRLPDTLSVQVRETEPGRTALWLYSRSQVGHADLGTNERRLRALVRELRRALPLVPKGE